MRYHHSVETSVPLSYDLTYVPFQLTVIPPFEALRHYLMMSSQIDGNESDAIAICGFAFKFPQNATSTEAFWRMLETRKCAMTKFPADRINFAGFEQSTGRRNNTVIIENPFNSTFETSISLNILVPDERRTFRQR